MSDLLTEVLTQSRTLGFLGPGPIGPHLDHAAAFAAVVDQPPARALDLGAGGGLPGLALAATVWPETRWTLLDAQLKRTTFLTEAVEQLGLDDRVTVLTARAEEVGRDPEHREAYDLVTARSFGPPAVTAECGAPLLVQDGLLVVSEPPAPAADRWPADGLATLGLAPADTLIAGTPPVHLVRLRRTGALPDRYPRRVGAPTKRPLF